MSTILIIDDDLDYRENLSELMQLEAYITLEAANGEIGLEMIHQHSPNLILCDVDMPVMDGIEVLRKTKSNSILAKIPFIINTGHSDELRSKMAQDLGVDAYLSKTVSVTELLSTITHFLSPQSDSISKG